MQPRKGEGWAPPFISCAKMQSQIFGVSYFSVLEHLKLTTTLNHKYVINTSGQDFKKKKNALFAFSAIFIKYL